MSTCTEQTSTATTPIQPKPFVEPVLPEVKRRLLASPFAAIKQLQSEFYEGVLILRGNVPTFYKRQIAITLAMKVDGVEQLDDRIVVR